MVHAFVELGMSELDAWRCVHFMQGRTSLVLVHVQPAARPFVADELPHADPEHLSAAQASGAAWSRLPGGGWQYLRCVRWRIADLAELQDDLPRLSAQARSAKKGWS
ncbi:MAG TPA: hypothetical protein VFZ93_04875 [Albitalea sp.]